jgi:hypothetical protein
MTEDTPRIVIDACDSVLSTLDRALDSGPIV